MSASTKPPFGPTPQRGRGRPARVFALTDRGSHAFDVAYDDLALSALRFLAEGRHEEDVEEGRQAHEPGSGSGAVARFARHRAQAWSRRHAENFADIPDVSKRVDALVDVLTEEGYAATSVVGEGGGVQICQHHCPVSHVAGQFPELCEAETQAFEQLLGTHVTRLATIAHGDGVCTTLVPGASGPLRTRQPTDA